MRINFAHLRERSTNGADINFIVFEANARNGSDSGRAEVLQDLTMRARRQGLRVDQSELAYSEHGRIRFYGSLNLVNYLSRSVVPLWTHSMEI